MIEKIKHLIRKIRLGLAEWMLPNRFFVQEKLYAMYCRKEYLDFEDDITVFNHRIGKLTRDANRWFTIRMLLDEVSFCAFGDYAELGTHQGRTARVIFNNMAKDSKLYCFDTFQGFDAKDVEIERKHSRYVVKSGDYGDTNETSVMNFITGRGESTRLVMCKGYFPDTAKGLEDVKWRFVHLDCDLAAPTKAGLNFFWKNLCPGGVILIHDYFGGFSEGIQNAFKGFSEETRCAVVPVCDGGGSAVIRKPW